MFFVYWVLFALVLACGVAFCSSLGGPAIYILGLLALSAVLAALAALVTKFRDLEEKIDKLLNEKKDQDEA